MSGKNKRKVYGSLDADAAADGIPCPDCACRHSYVVRTVKIGAVVRRTRRCRNCQRVFFTTEGA